MTAPKGYQAIGLLQGIKKRRKDMALIYSEALCRTAGTFTTNIVKAAPVKWDQSIVYGNKTAQAVVINSGIAKRVREPKGTGIAGRRQRRQRSFSVYRAGSACSLNGRNRKQLPMDKITAGIETMQKMLSESEAAGTLAAEAIMTTDTVKKEIAVEVEIGGKTVTVGGMSKGSGMIHPNMCTMLSFVVTDADISQELLQKALSENVKDTYNMISVDGDTSTNDTCLLLANGMAGNAPVIQENEDYAAFCEALDFVNTYLAKSMAADGEGATALFEVKVVGAQDKAQAVTLAKSVVSSTLTKSCGIRS